MRPIKDQHIVIEQQPDPSPNVTKASDIFLTPGDEDMVQHISPINKSGPQEIFSPWRKKGKIDYSQQQRERFTKRFYWADRGDKNNGLLIQIH